MKNKKRSLSMLASRAAIASMLCLCAPLVSCAANYALDIDQANKSIVQTNSTLVVGTTSEFTNAGISALDVYNSVYIAATAPPNGTGINACQSTLFDKFVLAKQTAISLSVIADAGSATATPIPIYTASTAPGTCNVLFDRRYVYPPQTVASVSHISIPAVYAYQISSNEKLSTYLKDAIGLAGAFVTAGGAPIVTSLTNITNSTIASDVRSDFNQAFSQKNQLQDNLLDITSDAAPVAQVSTTYNIVARPLRGGKVVPGGTTLTLGSITVTLERNLTLLGLNNAGHIPGYGSLSETTKLGTVVEDASGKKQFVYDYLDFIANAPPSTAVDNLKNLSASAADDAVKKACSQLRVTLNKLGLNRLDTAAFLWRVYTWSDYAQAKQTATDKGSCLESQGEWDLVKNLNLMGWLRSPRSDVRTHGVPKFCLPGTACKSEN